MNLNSSEKTFALGVFLLLEFLILYAIHFGWRNVYCFVTLFFAGKKTTAVIKDARTYCGQSSEGGDYKNDKIELSIATQEGKNIEVKDWRDHPHGLYHIGQTVELIYLPINPNRIWIGKRLSLFWFTIYLLSLVAGLAAFAISLLGIEVIVARF